MATRKAKVETKQGPTVEVPFPGGVTLICKAPDAKQWDRYLNKIRRGDVRAGGRELVQKCATSHNVEQTAEILKRWPASVKKIAGALDSLTGGDVEPVVDVAESTISFGEFTLRGPDGDEWESFQSQLDDETLGYGDIIRTLIKVLSDDDPKLRQAVIDQPGLLGVIHMAVVKVAGADFEVTIKKE